MDYQKPSQPPESINYAALAAPRAAEIGKATLAAVLQGQESPIPDLSRGKDEFIKDILDHMSRAAALPNPRFSVMERNPDDFTLGAVADIYTILGVDAPEFTIRVEDELERHERTTHIPGGSLEENTFAGPYGGYHSLTFVRTETTPLPPPEV